MYLQFIWQYIWHCDLRNRVQTDRTSDKIFILAALLLQTFLKEYFIILFYKKIAVMPYNILYVCTIEIP